jgi:excisionase family DNA binding protein
MNMPAKNERLLTIQETARRMGVHPQTASKAIKSGAIPSIRVGSFLRVPAVALERMLDGVAA